ncbi:MAG TPA: signal peptidase I [Candidatus Saccharimonadia bacterium]|nr:signal peptidase I [Candidatus Saccharimonadia bacterium]
MLKWLGIGLYAVCAVLIVMFLTPIGGWKALNVLTGSMKPAIQPGALVLVRHVPLRDIHPGDVVTYLNPHNFNQTITHRVVKIENVKGVPTFTVKGDANAVPDKPFPGGLVVGRVAAVIPALGGAINILRNPFVLASFVIIPGLFIIWAEMRTLKRLLRKPAAPPRPAPALAQAAPPPVQRPAARRSLDGVNRVALVPLVVGVLIIMTAGTFAAAVGTVGLTHNTFAIVASPTPTPTPNPTPCGNVSISHTGPGSTNIVTCTNNTSTTIINGTSVTVTNTSNQSSASGNVTSTGNNTSGSATSGNATNSNSTGTTVTTTIP